MMCKKKSCWLYLSTSLWGISLRRDLFRKSIDQYKISYYSNTYNQSQKLWDSHSLPPYSMLVAKLKFPTAWRSFSRLGTTLNHGEGRFWVSLSKKNIEDWLQLQCLSCSMVSKYFLALNFPIFQTRVAGEQQWDRQLQVVMLLSKRTKYI